MNPPDKSMVASCLREIAMRAGIAMELAEMDEPNRLTADTITHELHVATAQAIRLGILLRDEEAARLKR